MVHSIFCDHLNAFNDNQLNGIDVCMQMHETSMHCGSQLAADCHPMQSKGHKNFAGRRSLEKLYGRRLYLFLEVGGNCY